VSTSDCKVNDADLELVDPDLLPPQIRLFVQLIGLPDTITLLDARGGTFIRIPFTAQDSQLAKIIGLESAIILSHALGGEKKELPKSDKILTQIRNDAIRTARQHMSAAEVARKFGLTRRHVINLTHDIKDPQKDLFSVSFGR